MENFISHLFHLVSSSRPVSLFHLLIQCHDVDSANVVKYGDQQSFRCFQAYVIALIQLKPAAPSSSSWNSDLVFFTADAVKMLRHCMVVN